MKSFYLLTFLSLSIYSFCQNRFKITCSIINADSLHEATVFAFGDVKFKQDKIPVIDGKFVVEGELEKPCLAIVGTDKVRGGLGMWLTGENYEASFYVKKYSDNSALVQPLAVFGSKEAKDYLDFVDYQFKLSNFDDNLLTRNSLKCDYLDSYLKYNPFTNLSLFFLKMNLDICGIDRTKEWLKYASKDLLASKEGISLQEGIEKLAQNAIGKKIENFAVPDSLGNLIDFQQHINGYTLIVFWDSSCAPCREKNRRMSSEYDYYLRKNVKIISISFDNDKDKWLKAIKRDNMKWLQVSDLKGYDSPIVTKFKIKGVPDMLLVDKDMKIVANNSFDIGQFLSKL